MEMNNLTMRKSTCESIAIAPGIDLSGSSWSDLSPSEQAGVAGLLLLNMPKDAFAKQVNQVGKEGDKASKANESDTDELLNEDTGKRQKLRKRRERAVQDLLHSSPERIATRPRTTPSNFEKMDPQSFSVLVKGSHTRLGPVAIKNHYCEQYLSSACALQENENHVDLICFWNKTEYKLKYLKKHKSLCAGWPKLLREAQLKENDTVVFHHWDGLTYGIEIRRNTEVPHLEGEGAM